MRAVSERERIEEIFAFHNMSGLPLRSVNVIDGTAHYASKGMTIHMEGTPARQPAEDGINPAFAIAELVQAIPHLTAPTRMRGKCCARSFKWLSGSGVSAFPQSRGTPFDDSRPI